jgi:hypothetical protein
VAEVFPAGSKLADVVASTLALAGAHRGAA